MTDRPIQVGDLVQVVKPQPCCGHPSFLGAVFRVSTLDNAQGACCKCGHLLTGFAAFGKSDGWPTLVSRLKRIPPLEELEGERTQEDSREPA